MNNDCPCWGCEFRTPECHSDCQRYSEWNKKHTAMREAEHFEKEVSGNLYRQRSVSVGKAKKSARKKYYWLQRW